jgi:DNA processing protein
MTLNDIRHILALTQIEGIGSVLARKLLQHFNDPEEIFKTTPQKLMQIEGIGKMVCQNLKNKHIAFAKAEKELNYIQKHDIQCLSIIHAQYPEYLKQCPDAPVLLFSSGNTVWHNRRVISIVGTRKVTPYGIDFCRKLLDTLIPYNPIIVSGFAYGVDIVAHAHALDIGLTTVGVWAHGFEHMYPKDHRKYVARMEQNGGFLTEFWHNAYPDKENFVRRNRIVAGISEATIVIESADSGGSLITAKLANDYSREVFALPGRISDKYSQGCNHLIKTNQASLLTSADDLVYMLNWDRNKKRAQSPPLAMQLGLFETLTSEEQKIITYLQNHTRSEVDWIALGCEMPVFLVNSLLLQLELKGLVRMYQGKMCEII